MGESPGKKRRGGEEDKPRLCSVHAAQYRQSTKYAGMSKKKGGNDDRRHEIARKRAPERDGM